MEKEIDATDYTFLLTNLLNNKSDAEDRSKYQYRHQEQIFDVKDDNLYQNKDSYAPFLERL